MPHIKAANCKAWADGNKLTISDPLDTELELDESAYVLAAVGQAYDVSAWVDDSTTPQLVKKIIAMRYVGWLYDRVYSEDSDPSNYGSLLRQEADKLITAIVGGTLVIPGLPDGTNSGLNTVSFYPTDSSSALDPTDSSLNDTSLGPAKFSMGKVF